MVSVSNLFKVIRKLISFQSRSSEASLGLLLSGRLLLGYVSIWCDDLEVDGRAAHS